jgi:DNA repair protein RadD
MDSLWNYFQSGNTGNPVLCWPTGTGKSIVPAIFIRDVMKIWPTQRFLMMTHVKELIEQNLEVLQTAWPTAPVGVYSAGLKRKENSFPVIFGGIQSMYRDAASFGHRDVAFVDEAHLVNQDEASMYQKFFSVMKAINPYIKIIGMSATPWRMGQGWITHGGLFTDIVHDLTGMEAFNRLIAEGFLSPLIPKRTDTQLDISNVGIAKGEFIATQLQGAVDKQEITHKALRELVDAAHDRRSWLIFASGIEHADHIAEMLQSFGIECVSVHSKKPSEDNDVAIKAFKNFEIRAIVNYGKLTTGFNHPWIDCIGMLRPTLSVPLWVQMLGRGTRPADGKQNCLVLDFAKNTPRLGPINDPVIPRKKGEKQGDAPVKICNSCGAYNHASARFCCNCGEEFEFKIKIFAKASGDELIRGDFPQIEDFDVQYTTYAPHKSKRNPNSPPMMKVTYFTGLRSFSEYVCFEHKGYAMHKAHDWWKRRHKSEPPKTVAEALALQTQLRNPIKVKVWVNRHLPEVVGVVW